MDRIDLEAGNAEVQVEQEDQSPDDVVAEPENNEVQDKEPENTKKKKKHPYEIDYKKLPKGNLGRIIFEYNDVDMTWEPTDEENQEWLEDQKTQLGDRVNAFFLLLLSVTLKYRKEIQLEKQAKIANEGNRKGKIRMWLSEHCHKFLALLIWMPLLASLIIGYFINVIAGVVLFTIVSLLSVILFMSGCVFELGHKYADYVDYNYNMEIFASLKRMEREINKMLPGVNKCSFEPIGYKWWLYPNCRAFVLLKNSEFDPEEGMAVPEFQESQGGYASSDEEEYRKSYENRQSYEIRKSQENGLESQESKVKTN